MAFSPLVSQLIEAFRCLPGVGPKSAQRMALYLLDRQRPGGVQLAKTLARAMKEVQRCLRCRSWCETGHCDLCLNPRRDQHRLCIVETPSDVLALDQAGAHSGLYFVLSGRLSPIDGIGPAELGIPLLCERLEEETIQEVVLAISPTVEGEATTYYLGQLLKARGIPVSRIAYGIPLGGELEFVDSSTLLKAMSDRQVI